jgi:SSS family solute:Na+ symporter
VVGAGTVAAWIALGWNSQLPGLDGGLYEIVPGFIAAWLAIVLVSKATYSAPEARAA